MKKQKLLRNHSVKFSALLLSVTAHIGAAFMLGDGKASGQNFPQAPATAIVAALYKSASVENVDRPKPAATAQTEISPNDRKPELSHDDASAPESSDHVAGSLQTFQQYSDEKIALLPVPAQTEPYYYLTSELTENPVVVQDISPQNVAFLPDRSRRPVRISLLINEQGAVDEVVVEGTSLSEQAKRFLTEAFLTVKFRPGKIGGLAVKSELGIEVALEQVLASSVAEH